jgi:hypothetical protein
MVMEEGRKRSEVVVLVAETSEGQEEKEWGYLCLGYDQEGLGFVGNRRCQSRRLDRKSFCICPPSERGVEVLPLPSDIARFFRGCLSRASELGARAGKQEAKAF